jgi:putative serine protease PepD
MSRLVHTYIQQAKGHMAAGNVTKAIELLEKARGMSAPSETMQEILSMLSEAYNTQGDWKQAYLAARQNRAMGGEPAIPQTTQSRSSRRSPSAAKFAKAAGLVVLLIGILGGSIGIGLWISDSGPETPQKPAATEARPSWLGDSVGLIVITYEYVEDDGSVGEDIAGTGSCFAVSKDGYLLTNRHVVKMYREAARTVGQPTKDTPVSIRRVRMLACFGPLPSQHYKCEVVYADATDVWDRDLAILKVNGRFEHPVTLADSVVAGEACHVAGFPGDMIRTLKKADERDIYSRIRNSAVKNRVRYYDQISDDVWGNPSVSKGTIGAIRGSNIETDARMLPGNSGGPMFNSRWEAIGIATFGSIDPKTRLTTGVGYAIDLQALSTTIDREIQRHRDGRSR